MPPKPAVAAERLKKELAAQKARAEALKHLQSTGSGPSQRELAQQQQLRQKQTANATSAVAQRRVLGAQPQEQSAADKFDPRVRDNTLHAVALRRAQELQKTQQIEQKTESYRLDFHTRERNALPPGWQEVVDPASGDPYYWNEVSETCDLSSCRGRTAPGLEKLLTKFDFLIKETMEKTADAKRTGDQLADGWEEVPDAASGDVYYWNRKTNETTWTRPVARSVSLVQALEAKAKLDSILKGCGKPTGSSTNAKPDAKRSNATLNLAPTSGRPNVSTDASSNPVATKRPAAATQRNFQAQHGNKRRKHDDAIDPMDPTGTGGKWSDGLEQG